MTARAKEWNRYLRRRQFAVATCILLTLPCGTVVAQSLPQYRVTAAVEAVNGAMPGPGDLVRVRLGYLDPRSSEPVEAQVNPMAFMRTVAAGRNDCASAVRAFSLNKGLYRGAESLTGRLIVTANSDGTVSFFDPLTTLATANIFEVAQLPEPATAILPFAGEAAALLPRSGSVVLIDASGRIRTVARGLDGLTGIVAMGSMLYAVSDRLLTGIDRDGNQRFQLPVDDDEPVTVPLANSQTGRSETGRIAVRNRHGEVILINALDGLPVGGQEKLTGVELVAGNAAALLTSGKGTSAVTLRYFPGGAKAEVDPGFPPGGMLADGLGLHAFVWSKDGGKGAIIDLVRGVIADSFDLPAPPAEALFSGRSLFLNHKADADLTHIDTGPLTGGNGRVALRTYSLEAREPGPTPMALHDAEAGWIVALPRGMSVANVYGNGNPTAPMTTTPLRGSSPQALLSLDRTFKRRGPGQYEALGRLPSQGPVQLVTVTGDFRTIKCFDVASTAPPPPPEPVMKLAVDPAARAGRPFTARLTFSGLPEGAALPDRLSIMVRSMSGKFVARTAERQPDRSYAFSMSIGSPGQYPVSAEAHGIVRPAILVVEE